MYRTDPTLIFTQYFSPIEKKEKTTLLEMFSIWIFETKNFFKKSDQKVPHEIWMEILMKFGWKFFKKIRSHLTRTQKIWKVQLCVICSVICLIANKGYLPWVYSPGTNGVRKLNF